MKPDERPRVSIDEAGASIYLWLMTAKWIIYPNLREGNIMRKSRILLLIGLAGMLAVMLWGANLAFGNACQPDNQ